MPLSGTVRILLFSALTFVVAGPLSAGITEFPYEAVVESDQAFVYCGPGKQTFYPTTKLKRGDHVLVRRHDPGGWFMIDPPADSFSLVRADEVDRQGNTGTIRRLDAGQASVRIGSTLDQTADSIFQRRLSSGERIEIIGDTTVQRRTGPVAMLKIRAPKGEFRWIEGMNLAPLDPKLRQQNDADPFATPTQARGDSREPIQQYVPPQNLTPAQNLAAQNLNGQNLNGQNSTNPTSSHVVTANPVSLTQTPGASPGSPGRPAGSTASGTANPVDPRSRLEQIDGGFRDMVRSQPATWDLAKVEQAYRSLAQQTLSAAMRSQLELRFSSIEHYKEVKAEYDDYFRLVSDTSRKDAELAAVESSLAPQNSRPPVVIPPEILPSTAGAPIPTGAPATPLVAGSANAPPSIDPRTSSSLPLPPEPQTQGAPNAGVPTAVASQTAPPATTNPGPTTTINMNPPSPAITMTPAGNANPGNPQQFGPAPMAGGTAMPAQGPPRQIRPPGVPPLDGAGIVQRAARTVPGGPQHVLVSPNGRVLAYLYAGGGYNLDAYVGQPMGIFGPRSFRPELQTDLIVVRSMMPVRLMQ